MPNDIKLKNFKAFSDVEIETKPITLFLGPNNSGKSSILALNRLLTQTIQSYDHTVPLLLNGPLGDFGTYKDIVHGNSTKKHIEIKISMPKISDKNRRRALLYGVKQIPEGKLALRLKYKFRSGLREIVLKELELISGSQTLFQAEYSEESERHIATKVTNTTIPPELRSTISQQLRLYNFLPRQIFIPTSSPEDGSSLTTFLSDNSRNTLKALSVICDDFHEYFSNLEYLSATRLPPSRSFLYSGERHRKVGVNGENAANILAMDSIRKGKRSKRILEKSINWLKKADIASDIKIVPLSDRHYEIHIQNPHTLEYQNFADVGYGNSQVLPALVAGYNLEEGDTLVIEEPEIHLHPKAQAELGDFVLDLYNSQKNVLLETHSEHLVVRLQQHVASGSINKDDIAFYYIYACNGKKGAKLLTLDDLGSFKDEWPQGFFPQRLEEAKALAKLRAQRKAQEAS